MVIIKNLKDTEEGQANFVETHLSFSGEIVDKVTAASALADELQNCTDSLGETGD